MPESAREMMYVYGQRTDVRHSPHDLIPDHCHKAGIRGDSE
jgi:hypothetical protein